MNGYMPYADDHSVQEAVVAIHFRSAFESRVAERVLEAVKPALTAGLPLCRLVHKLPSVNIQENGGGLTFQRADNESRLAGFEFARIQANARPARVVRFFDNTLTVNFLDYESWMTTRKDRLDYVKTVLSSLVLDENPVVNFNLRYIDRYTFDGPVDERDRNPHAGLLMKGNNDYLSVRCFESGPYWHCNTGWFEHLDGGDRVLNQLEVGSSEVDRAPIVTIDHNSICQLNSFRHSVDSIFDPPSEADVGIESALDYMHGRNKEVLRNMLLEDVAQRIGL